ncbi:MAG: BatB protein [Sedimenticola sp.]|nr:MAG: BatB protein [Sedimenticola sp.]
MITFFWPWAMLLLPLPLLLRGWLRPRRHYSQALKLPFFAEVSDLAASNHGRLALLRSALPPFLVWTLLVCSLAQPLWVGDDQPVPVTGRDLMLLIDVSGSMRQMDFVQDGEAADRLTVVKRVASQFVEGRRGDRVGLILFGDKPYLRASLTHDRGAIIELIAEAEIALAGETTAIGDAIGLAIKRMRELVSDSRVIVLLTDGANNQGQINPRQAARLASAMGIRVYTIGVGAPDTPAPNPYGVWSGSNAGRFEQEVLEDMAALSNGRFFHVLDSAGLQAAYDQLDRLEPALGEDAYHYFAAPLYPWTLALALLLHLLMLLPGMFTAGSNRGSP